MSPTHHRHQLLDWDHYLYTFKRTARNPPCCSSCAVVISGTAAEEIWLPAAWSGEAELTVVACCCWTGVLGCVDGDEYATAADEYTAAAAAAAGEWLTAAVAAISAVEGRGPYMCICASPGYIGRATEIK